MLSTTITPRRLSGWAGWGKNYNYNCNTPSVLPVTRVMLTVHKCVTADLMYLHVKIASARNVTRRGCYHGPCDAHGTQGVTELTNLLFWNREAAIFRNTPSVHPMVCMMLMVHKCVTEAANLAAKYGRAQPAQRNMEHALWHAMPGLTPLNFDSSQDLSVTKTKHFPALPLPVCIRIFW